MSNDQLVTAIDQSINDAHGRLARCAETTRVSLIATVNAAREVGSLLIARKENTPHGSWLGLFKSCRGHPNSEFILNFDASWGSVLMRLAVAFPETVTELAPAWNSLTDVLRGVGALPGPSRGLQQSHGGLGPFSKASSEIMDFFSIIGKEREKRPVSEWPREQALSLLSNIEPVEKLAAEIRAAFAA